MANEKVVLRRGPSSSIPSSKVPGTILIETDTGRAYVDDTESSRIQIKDDTKLPIDGTAKKAESDSNGNSLTDRITTLDTNESTGVVTLKNEKGEAKGTVVNSSYVDTALSNKLDKTNPTGTGSFSLNRKANTTIGNYSFAEGKNTTASSNYSHAEGQSSTASGVSSHAEGFYTAASGHSSHAEGFSTTASGDYSHAEGQSITASSSYQHVQGKYNIEDSSNTYADIIGNGTSDTARSNAATVDWSGNAWYAGDVYVGSTSGTNRDEGSKKLATEEYVDSKQVQNDYEQNDSSAADYIKNRPFYSSGITEVTLVDDTFDFVEDSGHYIYSQASSLIFEEGKTYTVVFDGTSYSCIGYIPDNESPAVLGNVSLLGASSGNNEPFLIFCSDGSLMIFTNLTDASHTVKIISTEESIKKLDAKYLPDEIRKTPSSKMNKVNPTGTGSFSLNRKSDTTIGNYSFAEGYRTTASGESSHAEGSYTTASGYSSHAEGESTTASGDYSHAEGFSTTASSYASHAEGQNTTASSNYSHAEGFSTTASGQSSHAEGEGTTASSNYSHAEGFSTTASGQSSHAEGEGTKASSDFQHVQGKYNIEDSSNTYADIIGNGTSDTARSNAATVDWSGNAWYAGAVTSTGADYAEFFEWLDGNPNEEDRVGYLVALDGEKIKLASPQDEILGIISANPAILGDNYECNWKGKYLVDEFGRILYEKVEEFIDVPKLDEKTRETTIEKQSLGFFDRPKLNPDYDPNQEYTNRRDRSEWATVGMLGKLLVRDDGTSEVNGYVTTKENGVATASTEKTNIRVLSRVNDHIIKVYLK